jgi:hypothetical protein
VASGVSAQLEKFIRERLPSSEQIEIVLLLRSDVARGWTAPEVTAALGTPPESTAMRLFLLASNGVLVFEGSGVPRYRYAVNPDDDLLVNELADVWSGRREALADIVEGAGRDPLRTFADAFRLKK